MPLIQAGSLESSDSSGRLQVEAELLVRLEITRVEEALVVGLELEHPDWEAVAVLRGAGFHS